MRTKIKKVEKILPGIVKLVKRMMTTAKLLLHCPDKPGILAEVTDFITVNKGNIIYLDQYVDHVENIFFMRIEWGIERFLVPQEKIEDYLPLCMHRNMR